MKNTTSLASANPLIERCRGYFERFLPGLLGQLLIQDLEQLDAVFGIAVSDIRDSMWILEVKEGRLVRVGHEGSLPVCTFTVNGLTLLEIVSGMLKPSEAFFSMRVQITGDMEMGLMLSTVLEPFFRNYPYTGA